MKELTYEVLMEGIADTSDAPRDKKIFYKCSICLGLVPSIPKDSTGCNCGNIQIDKDMNRLWVGDYKKIVILKKL